MSLRKRKTGNSALEVDPLSYDEKERAIIEMEQRTISDDRLYRIFVLLVGFVAGLSSIWVTYQLERVASFSNFGLSINMISGLFFIMAGYRAYVGKPCKIKKELNSEMPAHELQAQEELLSSLKEYKDQMLLNKDNNPYIEKRIDKIKSDIYTKDFMAFRKKYSTQKYTKGVIEHIMEYFRFHQISWSYIGLFSSPFFFIFAYRLLILRTEYFEIIFPGILVGFSFTVEYLLLFNQDQYSELNALHQLLIQNISKDTPKVRIEKDE
eukprot:gene6019-10021_t